VDAYAFTSQGCVMRSLFIAVLVALVVALGRDPHASLQDQPTFSTATDLVVLHVNVQNRDGGFVTDLQRDAFAVFEDGRPQVISQFMRQDSPVTVGLVIDNSISMRENRDLVIAAAVQFAQAGHEGDRIFALLFNETVTPALAAAQPFTGDPAVLEEALSRSIIARGRTAFFDAVLEGLAYVSRGEHPRKVLVVIGDGGDNESDATLADMIRKAQASNVVIYTVALVDPVDREAKPERLARLAEVTGGETFAPRTTRAVGAVLQRIASDIRHTYTIGYASTRPPDDSFRRVRVIVSPPGKERLTVRTRGGYMATISRNPPQPSAQPESRAHE
jgi:Ca-activated chloride channel homolog